MAAGVEVRRVLIFMAAYLLSLQGSEHLYGSLAVPSPFWLPDAVLLCTLLLTGKQRWLIYVLAIWPIRLIQGAVPGTPEWFVVASTMNDSIKALVTAWCLERLLRQPLRLATFREFVYFIAVAAAIVPFFSAMAAAPARHALGEPVWTAAYRWFLGNALAQVIVTPTLLYWCTSNLRRITARRAEFALLSSGLALVLYYAFVSPLAGNSPAALYAPIPFLLWAAVRFGAFGTANALALVAIVSMASAVNGTGVFSSGSPSENVLSIQLFLLVLAVSLLSLATVSEEMEKKTFELADAEQRYRTVADFTADWEYWIRPDGSFAYVSPSCLQITGYDVAAFMHRPGVIGALLLDEQPAWDARHQLAARSDRPFTLESRIRTRSGEMRWLDVVISPVAAADGRRLGVRGSARDVTAKKRSEEELRRALDENQRLRNQLEIDNTYLREEAQRDTGIDGVLGTSEVMGYVVSKVRQVAPTASTVLLLGETGVGKSLLAQAIHNQSPRRTRPLVTLNCAALPPTLVESELFGHEKGAFTGAQARRAGRFEIAHGGTLFLDEIGELPLDLQAKLLRVVQDGEFERVGSSAPLKTDVRLIVATNRPMDVEVRAGRFRQDLWYRLNIFPITVPPLRQRPEDIPILAAHLLQKHCRKMGRPALEVSRATMEVLLAHPWPGNVRELENVVERAVILSRGKWAEVSIDVPHPAAPTPVVPAAAAAPHSGNGDRATIEDLQREHIRATLEDLNWRVEGRGGAAEVLGMNANTLRSRMRKLGLRRPGSRPSESIAS